MAEPALAEASAVAPVTSIKQEHEPASLDGLDFTFSPELASKRPFEDVGSAGSENPEAKRAKTESETEEASLEDGLALLVQNALSNVGDLVDQFTGGNDPTPEMPSPDHMDIDTTIPLPEPPAIRATFALDPEKFVREANIHALGNLALSLLLILVQPPFEDTIKLVRGSNSQHEQSFRKLKSSFEHVRDLYSSGPVLSVDQLGLCDIDSQTFIELANLAQLGSWLVDGSPKALSEADENFLAMFQCQLSDLPAGMTEMYLGIKTQRAIEFLVEKEPEKPSEEVIGEVLTQGLEDALKEQHGGGELTSADQNFVSSVQTRKETLQGEVKEEQEPAALRDKHPAEDLLRSYLEYATGRLRSLTDIGNKLGVTIELAESQPQPEPSLEATGDADLDLDDLSSFFEKTASGLVQNALAGLTDDDAIAVPQTEEEETSVQAVSGEDKAEIAPAQTNGKVDLMTDYKELEALVAESTSNYVKTTLHGLSPIPYQPMVPTSTAESMAAQLPYLAQLQQYQAQHPNYTYTQPPPEPQQPPAAPGENLPPNQTFPSSILYDKARQAALSKTSSHTRREGSHSTRRPWTQEEEKALMAGLDMVKGPHWSQILTLFGQSGTISDILRDRTQVQLKDKARNLKLFFLKTNSEMPFYLQAVTGELKTRAPTQAARKEAEERARLTSEDDQARIQGIMTLAGGLQHPPQGRTSASPATTVGSGVVTPAQAAAAQAASSAQHHVGHQVHTAGQGAHTPSMPRPMATPTPQSRPGVQTSTQHQLHAVAQAARPQAQLPPQVPRPQGQPQQQHHQPRPAQQQQQTQPGQQSQQPQAQHHAQQLGRPSATPQQTPHTQAQAQAQAQTHPAASHQHHVPTTHVAAISVPPRPTTTTPSAPHQASASPAPAPAAAPPAVHQHTQPPPTPSPVPQQHQASPAQHAHMPMTYSAPEASKPEGLTQQEQDDNAAEAALLEGLQAVVAQSLAS